MQHETNQLQIAESLAKNIMEYSRDEVMIHLRFLDRALYKMPFMSYGVTNIYGADGNNIYYDPLYVLSSYKKEKALVLRAFIHIIFHFVFSHPFKYDKMNKRVWDLAADLAVEQAVLDLKIGSFALSSDRKLSVFIEKLKEQIPIFTAENIYSKLLKDKKLFEKCVEYEEYIIYDDHVLWLPKEEREHGKINKSDKFTKNTMTGEIGCHEADEGQEGEQVEVEEALIGQRSDEWQDISEHAKTDLETFSREMGYGSSDLYQNLSEAVRDRIDYTQFLKKFAVLGEEMKISSEEFDYIYYTYGINKYGNMPLIEPLEYRESKRIREFAIAIDTSGSTQGESVHHFLRKTYSVLKNSASYFEKVNIHIIQCDSKIQEDVKITDERQLEDYIKDVKLTGFGGTDFRPVFEYVNKLIDEREFTNLKGLIYFTDGYGMFPEKMPDYDTAFVFVDEGIKIPEVPPWAIKLVLKEDEILG